MISLPVVETAEEIVSVDKTISQIWEIAGDIHYSMRIIIPIALVYLPDTKVGG